MSNINFEKAVIALGGNAVERDGDIFSQKAIADAAETIIDLSKGGNIAIVHGNGPQYGFLSQESTNAGLDLTSASLIKMSQDIIGDLLQSAILFEQVKNLSPGKSTIRPTIVTNTLVVVDPADPSFENPVKGVGSWSNDEGFFKDNNIPYITHPVKEGLFREVVPSPRPTKVVDVDSIQGNIDENNIVICGGGGGIPVFEEMEGKGSVSGEKMVVDKDSTAALIADGINADVLIILTNVDGFMDDFGTDYASLVGEMSSDEVDGWILSNPLGKGTMNPKLDAAASFVGTNESRIAIITSLEESNRLSVGDLSRATLIKPFYSLF